MRGRRSKRILPYFKDDAVVERFWSRVDIGDPEDCWEWTWGRANAGYGCMCFKGGRILYTHRIAYALTYGEIPRGLLVIHTCDNPPCVNPAHLEIATNRENILDAKEKGRLAKGEKHGSHVLSEKQVRWMLHLLNLGTPMKCLMLRYNVSRQTIQDIKYDRAWRHVQRKWPRRDSTPRGKNHGCAILNEKQVRRIFELLETGMSITCIARRYGVDRTTISLIKNGRTWRHLERERHD